jgi:argininosuccinate lyase
MKSAKKTRVTPQTAAPKKLWSGRFTSRTNVLVEQFTESLSYDRRLAPYDIMGSCAHAEMLGRIGVVTPTEARTLVRGLQQLGRDLANDAVTLDPRCEDIHMAIEAILTQRLGAVAKKLHTGRSRNDQVALDERLYLRDVLAHLRGLLTTLQQALLECAQTHQQLIMPGFTHLQYAMPVLVAHYLLSYVEMLERDYERLGEQYARVNVLPLGAAALAGSGFALQRAFIAKRLGFATISRNSMDSVADRDFLVEFLSATALIGMHLSRLAEDLIVWASQPYGFVILPDEFCTGSSLMPQKKNPDVLELVRGKTGRLYGNLVALLTTLKGLPMTYNRDMQEDKTPVFDSADTLQACLTVTAALVRRIRFEPARLEQALSNDFLLATDWAEYLTRRGMPFREAHELVGRAVALAEARGCGLTDVPLAALRQLSPAFDAGLRTLRTARHSVAAKRTPGSTKPALVAKELRRWRALFDTRARTTKPITTI